MSETTIAPIAGVTAGAPTSSRQGSRQRLYFADDPHESESRGDSRRLCVRKRGFGERVWSNMAGQCFLTTDCRMRLVPYLSGRCDLRQSA
jgi:hypothetical protein